MSEKIDFKTFLFFLVVVLVQCIFIVMGTYTFNPNDTEALIVAVIFIPTYFFLGVQATRAAMRLSQNYAQRIQDMSVQEQDNPFNKIEWAEMTKMLSYAIPLIGYGHFFYYGLAVLVAKLYNLYLKK